ncbi:P-loop containing nucleoside triphosphatehydrolases superfamily protein [Striga asiatica]|uniref:P-loop containing nucleoside triphosphatehydrolases superfamily protein n=1 Tax=Striga asiatica TaxID=4170 RepID=A0A5A7RB47_STRAF|nr:P-loop containing nucleoside triphosphatehydrolases superfamily protein [Striga asiatica]
MMNGGCQMFWCALNVRRLKIGRGEKDEHYRISAEKDQELVDTYAGQTFKWRNRGQKEFLQPTRPSSPRPARSSSCSTARTGTSSWIRTSRTLRARPEGTSYKLKKKTIKIHTVADMEGDEWVQATLDHPTTFDMMAIVFDMMAIDPEQKASVLNYVDGLWSSCGDERIKLFTTNHAERLDLALLRPGRMDNNINNIILHIKRPIRHKRRPANEALHDQLRRGSGKEIQVKHSSDHLFFGSKRIAFTHEPPNSAVVNSSSVDLPGCHHSATGHPIPLQKEKRNLKPEPEVFILIILSIVPTGGPRVDHDRCAGKYIVAHDFGVVSGFKGMSNGASDFGL